MLRWRDLSLGPSNYSPPEQALPHSRARAGRPSTERAAQKL